MAADQIAGELVTDDGLGPRPSIFRPLGSLSFSRENYLVIIYVCIMHCWLETSNVARALAQATYLYFGKKNITPSNLSSLL
jgi:hypothetical protein